MAKRYSSSQVLTWMELGIVWPPIWFELAWVGSSSHFRPTPANSMQDWYYLFDVRQNSLVIIVLPVRHRFAWWRHPVAPVLCHVVHPMICAPARAKYLTTKQPVGARAERMVEIICHRVSKNPQSAFLAPRVSIFWCCKAKTVTKSNARACSLMG